MEEDSTETPPPSEQEEALLVTAESAAAATNDNVVDAPIIGADAKQTEKDVTASTPTTASCSESSSPPPPGQTLQSTSRTQQPPQQQQQQQQQRHHVTEACYPLPDPLVKRLKKGIVLESSSSAAADAATSEVTNNNKVLRETTTDALSQLVGNAIQSIDAMYFAAPPQLRQRAAFQHRLCLRVRADPVAQTLSITDLGAGMTRADLINSLGIGRAGLGSSSLSSSKNKNNRNSASSKRKTAPLTDGTGGGGAAAAEQQQQQQPQEDTTTDEEDFEYSDEAEQAQTEDEDMEEEEDDDNDATEDEDEDATEEDDEEDEEVPKIKPEEDDVVTDCRACEIGGFYAALCALGVGIRVGTKSKFDDYYEFEVGMLSASADPIKDPSTTTATTMATSSCYDSFSIKRPREEGSQLTVENGFDRFEHVRGDSGTCITIRVNSLAIQQGFLDESKLKNIFLKIVETTQYTVAFSADGQADEIIQASAKEAQAMADLEQSKSQQDVDALDTVADMNNYNNNHQQQTTTTDTSRNYNSVKERAKYIPLRLSLGERKMLRLVEACMTCCDYTSSVDRPFKTTVRRTHEQLKGVTAVLRGLVTACDYKAGQKLLGDDEYAEYEPIFQQMFEIARRHKIMNPEKMRTEYGKLVYLLQDAVSPSLSPHLGFSVKGQIESVYKFLEERDGLSLLEDPLIETATEEILALKKTRAVIDKEIRAKERAVALLKKKYYTQTLSADDIHNCLYSICDNNSFLNSNRVPVDKVIDYLTTYFSPDKIDEGYSLSIVSGEDGARLSHNHERQYYFALQSLTLWRDIIDDMFRLWAMAEDDLLSDSVTYSLQDTGQGMQRVQQCPRTYKAMQKILTRVQGKVHHWVGSSVIHMGDHNVPNALSFIDKYTQVPRILGPIVSCLENLEKIYEKDDGIRHMVDKGFGGMEKVRKDILYDFFKSAFDGSGADNFYDAGSCIDGRMTSAWNWCSQLPEKPFYAIFKLTGFVGFDGEFK